MTSPPPPRGSVLSQSAINFAGAFLSIAIALALLFIIAALVLVKIPQENVQLLTLVLGGLLAAVATMVAYFYNGSLKESVTSDTNSKLATALTDQQRAVAPAVAAAAAKVAADTNSAPSAGSTDGAPKEVLLEPDQTAVVKAVDPSATEK
jgi:Na+-transporting methylmalonyl-CoA/oxaloacetate decarboxylase gamma subunit